MANYTITAANVLYLGGTPVQWGTAGTTIAAGEAVAVDPTTGKLVLAGSDVQIDDHLQGIALASATLNQPLPYATAGANVQLALTDLDVSSEPVFLSQTPGKLIPHTDIEVGLFGGVPVLVGFLYDAAVRKNIKLAFAWADGPFND